MQNIELKPVALIGGDYAVYPGYWDRHGRRWAHNLASYNREGTRELACDYCGERPDALYMRFDGDSISRKLCRKHVTVNGVQPVERRRRFNIRRPCSR